MANEFGDLGEAVMGLWFRRPAGAVSSNVRFRSTQSTISSRGNEFDSRSSRRTLNAVGGGVDPAMRVAKAAFLVGLALLSAWFVF
jgi:hypothetical protein